MNGVYLRRLSPEEFAQQATSFLDRDLPPQTKRPLARDYICQITPLLQERARTLAAVPQLADFFFLDELPYDTSLLLSSGLDAESATQAIKIALQRLEVVKTWDASSLEGILRPLATELNLTTGKFFGLLRAAITGRTAAPPLFQTMTVLGQEKCLKRLIMALQKLSALL
jgi:glutamyl-tRNA synthetase